MLVLGGDRIKGVARFDLHANANANDSWIELILSSGFRVVLLSRADPRLEGRWGGEGCVIRKYLRKREFFGKTIDRWMMVERQDSCVGRSLKKVFGLSAAGPTRPG